MSWCIYKHTNKINGKVYIGQTCQKPESRWQNGKGYKGCPKFWSAIQEFGWDGFEHEILVDNISTQEEANKLEREYIIKYNSCKGGYNAICGQPFEILEPKPIYYLNVYTGEIKEEFDSISKAAKALGISNTSISETCHHRRCVFLNGYTFRFKEEWDNRITRYVPSKKSIPYPIFPIERSDGNVYSNFYEAARSVKGGKGKPRQIIHAIEKHKSYGGFTWRYKD